MTPNGTQRVGSAADFWLVSGACAVTVAENVDGNQPARRKKRGFCRHASEMNALSGGNFASPKMPRLKRLTGLSAVAIPNRLQTRRLLEKIIKTTRGALLSTTSVIIRVIVPTVGRPLDVSRNDFAGATRQLRRRTSLDFSDRRCGRVIRCTAACAGTNYAATAGINVRLLNV